MLELVDVVCHQCRIKFELLDAPGPREAWWKFLDEHAYHPVELMWEHSEARDRIDIDYIHVDSDIEGDPSFAEYAGDWPGRPLALQPRPIARAVAEIVRRAFDAVDAHEWQAAPADEAAAERIMQYMDFAPRPVNWSTTPPYSAGSPRWRRRWSNCAGRPPNRSATTSAHS
ncbi:MULTISPECIES: hypothetical protein [Streptomyces]|nr:MULTISPECIES: hypothetical protein [Streptomyces]MYT05639.1 hypothetical protein [Streptomyces sp. SID5470]